MNNNNNNNRLKVITTAALLCCAVSTLNAATAATSCSSLTTKTACQNEKCMWFGPPKSPHICGTINDLANYDMHNLQCKKDAPSFLQKMQFYAENSGGTPPTGVQFKQCHMKVWNYFDPKTTYYHVHSEVCAATNANSMRYWWKPGNINTFNCN
jgi:hypothetical protein